MTSSLILKAETRKKEGKKTDAPLGTIPGVLYGRGIKNVLLWFSRREFNRIREEAGESTIFKIQLPDGDERNVLIKEIQRDILNGKPTHVDFYQVRMDEKIEANVELDFVGESQAVKDLGGILIKNIDEIEVKCLPGDLPSKIEIDISRIKKFDDYIYVKDLPVSDKVEVLADPENVVAMVSEPRSEGVVKPEKPEEAGETSDGEKVKEKKEPARNDSRSDAGGEKEK